LPYIKHRCFSPSTENTSGTLGGLVPSLRATIWRRRSVNRMS
jgi:hypothetical protein